MTHLPSVPAATILVSDLFTSPFSHWAASWASYLQSHFFQSRGLVTQPPVTLCQLQGHVHPPRCAQPGSFWPFPTFLASFQHMLPGSRHASPARASTLLPLPVGSAAPGAPPRALPHLQSACFFTIILINTFIESNSRHCSKHALHVLICFIFSTTL